jgi:hypothetical protein
MIQPNTVSVGKGGLPPLLVLAMREDATLKKERGQAALPN